MTNQTWTVLAGVALLFVVLSSTSEPVMEVIPPNEPLNTKLPRSMGGDYGDENE